MDHPFYPPVIFIAFWIHHRLIFHVFIRWKKEIMNNFRVEIRWCTSSFIGMVRILSTLRKQRLIQIVIDIFISILILGQKVIFATTARFIIVVQRHCDYSRWASSTLCDFNTFDSLSTVNKHDWVNIRRCASCNSPIWATKNTMERARDAHLW